MIRVKLNFKIDDLESDILYPSEVIRDAFEEYMKRQPIRRLGILGKNDRINLLSIDKASHIVHSFEIKGKTVYVNLNALLTPAGNILDFVYGNNVPLEASLHGTCHTEDDTHTISKLEIRSVNVITKRDPYEPF